MDEDDHTLTTVVENTALGISKRNTISVAGKWDSIDSTADYLQAEGLLEYEKQGYLRLNHKGYYYLQSVVLSFIAKSIVVPLLVALATTLITLWIQARCPK